MRKGMRRISKNTLRATLRRFNGVLGIEPLTSYGISEKRPHSSVLRQKRGNPIYSQKQGQGWRENMPKTG